MARKTAVSGAIVALVGVELPFGGYNKSGYGREKGLESLATHTQVKNVCVKFS